MPATPGSLGFLVLLRVHQLGDDLPLVPPGAGSVRVPLRLLLGSLLPS